jgi:hypothetical protein
MAGPIGILANPASGKDVRRLVARASVFDNQEKCAIVRRALVGAINAGARDFVYMNDSHGIAAAAIGEFPNLRAEAVEAPQTSSSLDTERAAASMQSADCAAVLILGGDGTSRAFVRGWRNAPLLPLSTGTNNVFPRFAEATVAGAAVGLVASGVVALPEVAQTAKVIDVEIEDEDGDMALIDAVVTTERFIGARALLEGDALRLAMLTRAEAAAVGMTSLGGLLQPMDETTDAGLVLTLGGEHGRTLRAPIAPGYYQDIVVADVREVPFAEPVGVTGPCVLAFDGERERTLKAGQRATLSISRTGPSVLDVSQTLRLGACRGAFLLGD